MRTTFLISFALATVATSTAALAAGDSDVFKRRFAAGQQFLRPPVKPAGQAQFAPTLRPQLQTIAPRILSGPKPVAQLPVAPQIRPSLPIQAKFAIPARPTGTPDVKLFNLVQPASPARPPVLNIKQTLPVQATLPVQPTRRIEPEAAVPTQVNFTPAQLAAPVAPRPAVQQFAAQPVAAAPAPVAPAPQVASTNEPDTTGTLQPEVSADAAPAAPQPADTQALIQADAAQAPAAPVAAPVAAAAPATPGKEVRIYVQDTSDGYSNGGYGSGYHPRVSYAYDVDYGYDNSYNGGGYYGSNGCE